VNIASSTVFYSTDCAGSVVGKCRTQTTLDIRSFGAFSINILNAERLPVPTIRLRAVVLIRGTLMMHGACSPCMHGAFSLQGIFCFPMPLSSSVTSRPSCQATPSSETGDIIIFREPRPRTQTGWTDHGQLSFVLSLTLELFLVLFNPAHDVAFQGRAKSLFFPLNTYLGLLSAIPKSCLLLNMFCLHQANLAGSLVWSSSPLISPSLKYMSCGLAIASELYFAIMKSFQGSDFGLYFGQRTAIRRHERAACAKQTSNFTEDIMIKFYTPLPSVRGV
jgi:hypothetical protein